MSIRQWFGYAKEYSSSEFNQTLDELLQLYANSLSLYFDFKYSKVASFNLFMNCVEPTDKLFIGWLKEKGIDQMLKLASITKPENAYSVPKLKYEIYALKQEMNTEHLYDPQDLRASLIGIANELINSMKEVFEEKIK